MLIGHGKEFLKLTYRFVLFSPSQTLALENIFDG